jgi:methionyl-tRNA formyltransferase
MTDWRVCEIAPRYMFFLHWSSAVPARIVDEYECVGFHMTDLPYGRGGSPLQNLIARGHRETKLTAYRMVEKLDQGPVYLKETLSLVGSAEEILIRATQLSAQLIRRVIAEQLAPIPQSGTPTIFKRRRPEQSRLSAFESIEAVHDFIRMLDAETYPRAFLEHEGFRYEFRRSQLRDGKIAAEVSIVPVQETEE